MSPLPEYDSELTYRTIAGRNRRVRVTSASETFKNGRAGFTGVDLDTGKSVWGYCFEITATRAVAMRQPKREDEPTRLFHVHIVNVYQGDSWWVVPSNGDPGAMFDKISLNLASYMLWGLVTKYSAPLNAELLPLNEQRRIIDALNTRYPSLRLMLAE